MKLNGTDGKILGVAAGLSHRSGIHVILIRATFVVFAILFNLLALLAYGIGGLFVEPRPKLSLPHRLGMVLFLLGAVLGAVLFIFVSETNIFGIRCYHVGSFSLSTACIKPHIYRGAWVVVAALIGSGLWLELKSRKN